MILEQNPSAESGYFKVLCADGNFRHWEPVLAAWLQDKPEYSDLQHLEQHVCIWCECPKIKLGDYDPPDKQHPWRDHNVTPLLLAVYFWDHTGSLDNPNMDNQLVITNYHSDFRLGSTFQISSLISNNYITRPLYQLINDRDLAKHEDDVHQL